MTVREAQQPPAQGDVAFLNPFHIEDLEAFDDTAMRRLLDADTCRVGLKDLAWSLHDAPHSLVKRVRSVLERRQRAHFTRELRRSLSPDEVQAARGRVLDALFWELTYWKTPELYEELTEGEQLHPGIFRRLASDVRGKIVLDAGAGSGRATFECLRYGAKQVYAVEPSPGLRRILEQKAARQPASGRVSICQGDFSHIPLENGSVDVALSCSAFTAEPVQGGEAGLAELRRVTKRGGKIVVIWPRQEDCDWLAERGFTHVTLPVHGEMVVQFRSLHSALRSARLFYGRNKAVARYIRRSRRPEVPYSVVGSNPPCNYCWVTVQ